MLTYMLCKESNILLHYRYNKQVLKVFPYPITCTTIQVCTCITARVRTQPAQH